MTPHHSFLTRSIQAFLIAILLVLLSPATSRAGYESFQSPSASTASEVAFMSESGRTGSPVRGGLSTNGSSLQGEANPSTEARSIRALKLNGTPIQVDGKLDDAPWRDAQAGYDFHVWDPDRGKNPSEATVFKVAYDEDAIYFGVACHEQDPAKVARCLAPPRPNQGLGLVSIYLDPYLDRTTGYNFA